MKPKAQGNSEAKQSSDDLIQVSRYVNGHYWSISVSLVPVLGFWVVTITQNFHFYSGQ
ncbi:hypothetical protein M405DRAFT_827656, partial [Rhizopogon salebrosus TDB-379]